MVVTLGICGIGFMGGLLLELLTKDGELRSRAKVAAVCDIRQEALEKARSLGVQSLYTSYTDMLEKESLDAVIIATPPHLHKEQAVEALKKGLYVLLEKPMSVDLRSALEIYRNAGNRLMLAFSLYFHELFQKIKKYLDTELGEPLWMWHIAYGKLPPAEWVRYREYSGGMLNEHTVHVFFVYRWYAGEVSEVWASTWTIQSGITIEDNAAVTIRHRDGAVSVLLQSWSGGHRWRKWGIQASRGRATVEGYLVDEYVVSRSDGTVLEQGRWDKPVEHMYINELKAFLDAVENRMKPYPNEEDGIKVQEIVEAIYRSAKEGRPIKLPIALE